MAANDYHVIVYEILAYLYDCLKNGIDPDIEAIKNYQKVHGISARYWSYVLVHLLDDGYIEGAEKIKVMGAPWAHIKMMDDLAITPKGIGYLMDNSLMEKVKKEAVAVVSAIAAKYIG